MSKTTLVFDFNNMMMRDLFTCNFMEGVSISDFTSEEERNVFVRKMAMDMSYVLRTFNPDRVIVAVDAKHPWRNSLYDPNEDESYKGTRVKDETKNWDKIWESVNDFLEVLKQKNFIVSQIQDAEADDLAALWKQRLFIDAEDNVILVSSDHDWHQLVDFNPIANTFCVCYNPIANNKKQKKLYITQECSNWLNTPTVVAPQDIFFSVKRTSGKKLLSNCVTKDPKINFEVIDACRVALDKIMCGDDGDNAPAFYQYYKDGKKTRVTPAKAKKIFEDLNITSIKDLCESADAGALKTEIEKVLKKELDDIDIDERLMRQRKLVELNPMLFPDNINKAFNYHAAENVEIGYVMTENIKLDNILLGTKFLKEDYKKPRENGIFDNLKDLEKYIKPTNALF